MITGPLSGNVGQEYEYIFNALDLDGDDVYYYIDWGDGVNSSWLGPFGSGVDIKVKHVWDNNGTYMIKVKAKDVFGAESDWGFLEVIIFDFENQPPNTPIIDGRHRGNANTEYDFTFNSIDPDGDDVRYYINWGDTIIEWTGYNNSGTNITVKHKFKERRYHTITAKAQDIHGSESPVGTFAISIPRNIPINFNIFGWLFERFPNLFPIFRHILGFQ